MPGPFSNPWTYAARRIPDGRWAMVNTCHDRIVSTHATEGQARSAIADRKATLASIRHARGVLRSSETAYRRNVRDDPPKPPEPKKAQNCAKNSCNSSKMSYIENVQRGNEAAPRETTTMTTTYTIAQVRQAYELATGKAARRNIARVNLEQEILETTDAATVAAAIGQVLDAHERAERQKAAAVKASASRSPADRSEAAKKAWATRRANGWTPSSSKPAPAPLKRASLAEIAKRG